MVGQNCGDVMTFFLFILIIIFCLLAYYFGANEFVVRPLISKRKKQGKHISKAFFIYSWILGLCFLGLLFLSFYLTGFFKIIPSIILLIWILLFYIKNQNNRNKMRFSDYNFHFFKNYYFEFLKRAFMSTTIIKAKNKATPPITIKEV